MQRTTRLARNLALIALLSSPGFSQTTWYVDVNNVPPGSGTLGDPYTSIAAAHDAPTTLEGDTIHVAPGIYVEGSLDLVKRITVASTGGAEQTFLRETFVSMGTFNAPYPLLPILDGFTVTHSATDLHESTRLIDIKTGTLRRCILRDTHFTALFIDEKAIVEETTIAGNLRAMAGFVLAWQIYMRNSIIWGNTLGVDTFGLDTGSVDYSAGRLPSPFGGYNTGNVVGDPGFWSLTLGDYRLRAGSPCIDSGDPANPNDADGSRIDMGALTYDPGYEPGAYSFCEAAAHSAGPGAYMSMAGERSLVANAFTLVTETCPPNKIGLYYYGPNEIQAPFGDGFRCVGGSTTRIYPALFADGAGTATRALDFTSPPANAGNGAITPGSTWKFQFWYRDPMGPGGMGFNVSDGLSVTFEP